MKFNSGIVLALAVFSPFLALEADAAKRLVKGHRGGGRGRRVVADEPTDEAGSEIKVERPVRRRRLSGKGKGKGGGSDDEFYRFPCEFCGKGNDSALGLSPVSCFSKDSTVQVQGVDKPVKMEDLKVGDKVLTQQGTYEDVYAFGHFDPTLKATFLQLHTNAANPLEITGDHLVYVQGKANPVRASAVRPGDVLRSSAGTSKGTVIQEIRTVEKTGVFAPLTTGGRIAVDGIMASSYISLQDTTSSASVAQQSTMSEEYLVIQGDKVQLPVIPHQHFVHMALSPYRMACRVGGSDLCDTTTTTSSFSGAKGMPTYVSWGIWLNHWASRHLLIHPLAIAAVFMATGPFWCLEKVLFVADAPMITLAILAAIWFVRRSRVSVVTRKVKSA